MAELLEFIKDVPFGKDLQNLLEPLKIKIKEEEFLYMLYFLDDADFSDPIVRQANGIILEKNTNKIIHYSFEKTYEGISWESKDPYSLKQIKNFTIEPFFEGSIIKIFYYDYEWCIATSRHINATKNKWSSNKTFKDLFAEGIQKSYNTDYDSFLENLEKNYSHTFLLQHPENQLISKIAVPVVFYVNRVENSSLKEEKPEDFFTLSISLEKMLEEIENDGKQNYMVYCKDEKEKYTRIKFLCNTFQRKLYIRGDNPDITLSYLEITGANKEMKDVFLELYPEHSEKFKIVDTLLLKAVEEIYNLYVEKYIHKTDPQLVKRYIQTLNQLHGQYKKTKKPITFEDVYNKVSFLNPKSQCFVIDYNKKSIKNIKKNIKKNL